MLIGLFCLALAVFCLSAGILQGPVVRDSLFEWEKTTASSLLEQGVDASLVAEAFHAKVITPEGERLVEQIGHTQENTSALFPEARMAMLRNRNSFVSYSLSDDIFVSQKAGNVLRAGS